MTSDGTLSPRERLLAAVRKASLQASKHEGCAELQALIADPSVGEEAARAHERHCREHEPHNHLTVRRLRRMLHESPVTSIADPRLSSLLPDVLSASARNLKGAGSLREEMETTLTQCLAANTAALDKLQGNFDKACKSIDIVARIHQPLAALDAKIPLPEWRKTAAAVLERTATARIEAQIKRGALPQAKDVLDRLRQLGRHLQELDPKFDPGAIVKCPTRLIEKAQEELDKRADATERLRRMLRKREGAQDGDAALGTKEAELLSFLRETASACTTSDEVEAWWKDAAVLAPRLASAVPEEAFTEALKAWQGILEAGLLAARNKSDVDCLLTELGAKIDRLPPVFREWIKPRAGVIGAIAAVFDPDWVLTSRVPAGLDGSLLPIPSLVEVRLAAMRELKKLADTLKDPDPIDEMTLHTRVTETLCELETRFGPSPEITTLRSEAAKRLFALRALPLLREGRVDEFRQATPLDADVDLTNSAWTELANLLAAPQAADVSKVLDQLECLGRIKKELAATEKALPELRTLLDDRRGDLQRQGIHLVIRVVADCADADLPNLLTHADALDATLDGADAESLRAKLREVRCSLLKRVANQAVAGGNAIEVANEVRELQSRAKKAGCGDRVQNELKFALDLLDAEQRDDAALLTWLWRHRRTLEQRSAERVRLVTTRVAFAFAGDPSADCAEQCRGLVEIAIGLGPGGAACPTAAELDDLRRWFALRLASGSSDLAPISSALEEFLRVHDISRLRAPFEVWADSIDDPWVRSVLHHAGSKFTPPLFADAADPLDQLQAEALAEAERRKAIYRSGPAALAQLDDDIKRTECLRKKWVDLKAIFDGDPQLPRIEPPSCLNDILNSLQEMRDLRHRLEVVSASDLREKSAVCRLEAVAGDLRQQLPSWMALTPLRERANQMTAARGLPLAWQKCQNALQQCAESPAERGGDNPYDEALERVETLRSLLLKAGLADSPCAAKALEDVRRLLAKLVGSGAHSVEIASLDDCKKRLTAFEAEETKVREWLRLLEELRPPVPEGARIHPESPEHRRFLDALHYLEPAEKRARALVRQILGSSEYAFLREAEGVPSWIRTIVGR